MELPFYSDLDPRKSYYRDLDPTNPNHRHILERLSALRNHLDESIPRRSLEENLIIATWNIREFDSSKYGFRLAESMFYLAEIVSRFDIMAVQEVKGDLRALILLNEYLGGFWDYIVSDVTAGRAGNNERMAILYDTRKIKFTKLAGELVLPPRIKKDESGRLVETPVRQPARSPFVLGFQSGWLDFMIVTLHAYFGEAKPDNPRRVKEIEDVAKFLKVRSEDRFSRSRNIVLLGDFNIFGPDDLALRALADNGFRIPSKLWRVPTNVKQDRIYDQIALLERTHEFSVRSAGIFDFFETVYRVEDEAYYGQQGMVDGYSRMKNGKPRTRKQKQSYYNIWRTFQISDHLPLWIEVKADFNAEYLESLAIE